MFLLQFTTDAAGDAWDARECPPISVTRPQIAIARTSGLMPRRSPEAVTPFDSEGCVVTFEFARVNRVN